MRNSPKYILLIIIGMSLSFFTDTSSTQSGSCKPLILHMDQMEEFRALYLKNTSASKTIFQTLLSDAGEYLKMKPLSVMDKTQTPPSGNKHDYMSMGPYWWPDTSKPNGIPYIRRDGERNPEYESITDARYYSKTVEAVEILALAFALTKESTYAKKVGDFVRICFHMSSRGLLSGSHRPVRSEYSESA